jgi:hypothetical protein
VSERASLLPKSFGVFTVLNVIFVLIGEVSLYIYYSKLEQVVSCLREGLPAQSACCAIGAV